MIASPVKCFISQPAQYQGFTAHRRYFYRCFLPDLTEFKICLLRKAENISTAYETAHFQQNSPTGIQSCIKRVSGYREPLPPHLAQSKVFYCYKDDNLHYNRKDLLLDKECKDLRDHPPNYYYLDCDNWYSLN